MNVYLIKFKKYDYDQYDSFVVMAKDKNNAVEILKKEYPLTTKDINRFNQPFEIENNDIDWNNGYEVKKINLESEGRVLLGSFNAG